MANLKVSPDLFIEAAELNRFKQFIDDNGFRKNILENSAKFGLIKTSKDFNFYNGRVERDLDTQLGQRTIKIRELFAIDSLAQFIHLLPQNGIPVPEDGNWYWVKVAHAYSNVEKGKYSISGSGDLVDTSGTAELTKILRGMPNFPVRIKFTNSVNNSQEYDVLEVIDDQHAVLQHPATNSNGISTFTDEVDLNIEIIGTFTQGVNIPSAYKKIYNYDSAVVTLVAEPSNNSRPIPYVQGQEFYIARVKSANNTVVIQDKRTEYWETKGSNINLQIDLSSNPCIGVESAQFNHPLSPADKNIVKVAWGFRSNNWSVDSSNNIVTFNSGLGGKYKTVNDFKNGDLVGGRLYTSSGKYANIIASAKQGNAVNFTLDVLDVDSFSPDGGITFNNSFLIATPDAEEVEVRFIPHPADNVSALAQSFCFPVNELVGRCDVLVYKDPDVLYNVSYRYKSLKEFTEWKTIPSDDLIGYYSEGAFDTEGNIKSVGVVTTTYIAHPTNGFIRLTISPYALSKFKDKVDKGDVIGVTEYTNFENIQVIDVAVGNTDNYIRISGDISLPSDITFAFDKVRAVEGNEFRVHIDCTSFLFNGKKLVFVQDYNTSEQVTLKEIKQGDIWSMFNQEGGIVFNFKYTGETWVVYQNYNWGKPYELATTDGVLNELFDEDTGLGKMRGWFGYVLCNEERVVNGISVPNLSKRFIAGFDQDANGFSVGDTGGEETHKLTVAQLPKHDFYLFGKRTQSNAQEAALRADTATYKDKTIAVGTDDNNNQDYFMIRADTPDEEAKYGKSSKVGNDESFPITPLYYAVIYAKKAF